MNRRHDDDTDFLDQWRALSGGERRRVRRLVRLGRPVEPADLAPLGAAYARFQSDRRWSRLFWLWFVPGFIVALDVAVKIHPIAVGALLALAAQAVVAHRNLAKAAAAVPIGTTTAGG